MPSTRRIVDVVNRAFGDKTTTERIEEVVEELARLQKKQDSLLRELGELAKINADTISTANEETLTRGDRVRIRNPKAAPGRRFVAGDHRGTVVRVSETRVYYDTDSGQKNRYRSFDNVVKVNDESPLDLDDILHP
jgi:hypothetical protein